MTHNHHMGHVLGLFGMAFSIVFLWITKEALSNLAAVATICAGFSTAGYYLYNTFNPLLKKIIPVIKGFIQSFKTKK